VKRLFIEVQYDPELGEVEAIHCSGTEWNELNAMDRCDVYDAVGHSLSEAILVEYQEMESKKPKLVRVK